MILVLGLVFKNTGYCWLVWKNKRINFFVGLFVLSWQHSVSAEYKAVTLAEYSVSAESTLPFSAAHSVSAESEIYGFGRPLVICPGMRGFGKSWLSSSCALEQLTWLVHALLIQHFPKPHGPVEQSEFCCNQHVTLRFGSLDTSWPVRIHCPYQCWTLPISVLVRLERISFVTKSRQKWQKTTLVANFFFIILRWNLT